ncbi:MAG: hypothetical protein CMM56_02180 [Rhodospirillaceae bacterium]|nr:hypothetical protein [Rhodospirillaceae bacterium]|tara:strand:+ start:7280 stop:7612 length:333 start_codon:yes stop_codon:yes gene_type:complete
MSDIESPKDHVAPESNQKTDENSIEENIKARSTWLRLLFMVLFFAIWSVSRVVVIAVMVLQFIMMLVSGKTNNRLTRFGQSLATYSYQLVAYLVFVTDKQPFPFDEWPGD